MCWLFIRDLPLSYHIHKTATLSCRVLEILTHIVRCMTWNKLNKLADSSVTYERFHRRVKKKLKMGLNFVLTIVTSLPQQQLHTIVT